MGAPAYTWVDTPKGLATTAARLSAAGRMAVDTEGDSLYHYSEKICLIQISTDCATFVIDPLALPDLSALRGMMADPAIEKVFHASGQDIVWLRRDHGFSFSRIFDTHMAAQLLGYERIGLDTLLEEILQVAHSKHLQRADWSRRPLSPEEIAYAAMDTHYLLALRDVLDERLADQGRREWAAEEFELLARTEYRVREFDPEGYRRIQGSLELGPGQRAMLRALFVLREQIAAEVDLPPFKVINGAVLLSLARRPPHSPDLLARRGVPRRVAQRYGEAIIATLNKAMHAEPAPRQLQRRTGTRPSPAAQRKAKDLRLWRAVKAQELGLPVGVVLPNSILSVIAAAAPSDCRSMGVIEGMRRWRVREFGEEILKVLDGTVE